MCIGYEKKEYKTVYSVFSCDQKRRTTVAGGHVNFKGQKTRKETIEITRKIDKGKPT